MASNLEKSDRARQGQGVKEITIKISTPVIYIVNIILQSKYRKMLVKYKILKDNYLHLWPASDPPVCISSSCGRPDEGWVPSSVGICAAIVPIGVAPGVDEIAPANHGGFGFEVAFASGSSR